MTDKENAYLNHFAINEGAYFYRRNFELDNREIKKIFLLIRENAHSHKNIVEIIKHPFVLGDGTRAYCSLKVFTDEIVPSFLKDLPLKFQNKERLICYFLLIEIGNFLVLFSRHANGLSSFKNKHTPVNGLELAGSLVNEDTVFTQMRIGNMNMNQFALRNKSFESNDLSQSMPTFGVNRQILKTTRIQKDDANITLGLSTSRVSKIGSERKSIISLCQWATNIIKGIESPNNLTNTLMGQFSIPIKWMDVKEQLKPAYIMFDKHELMNHVDANKFGLQYITKDKNITLDIKKLFDRYNTAQKECKILKETVPYQVYNCDTFFDLLEIIVNKTGMRLRARGRLDNLYLVREDGTLEKFFSYISTYQLFYIGFENIEYIYHGNQLHQDGNIFNSLESILSVFKGIPEMKNVKDEKGDSTKVDEKFADNTVFNVVENIFHHENATHIICDDLGYECADHIVLSENRISFIHSKAKGKTMLSASAFQEVIGQALKNIGNMRKMNISDKVEIWRHKIYPRSNIKVWRHGDVNTFEDTYYKILLAPNGITEICLAIDFISLSELKQAFEDLKNGKPLRQKYYVTQMIWLLSAFISACKDADMQCRIFCRE